MTTETETVADVLDEMESLADSGNHGIYGALRAFATRIAAAHAREVELLKQANIAYSSENANLRGRAMAAEKDAEDWRFFTSDHDLGGGEVAKMHIIVGVNVWRFGRWIGFEQCTPEDARGAVNIAQSNPVREVLR